MAEDAARALAGGAMPASIVPHSEAVVDIATSLAPWIAIYDESGTPLESSGVFSGAPPKPPQGVFDVARANQGKDTSVSGQNRVSWQPAPNVRSAIVIQHFLGTHPGYVVAGRSMREVEVRESRLHTMIVLGWLVILGATLLVQFAIVAIRRS